MKLEEDEEEICNCNNGPDEHLMESESCPVNDPKNRCDTEDCENIVLPNEGYDLGEDRRNSCKACKHSHDHGDDEPDFEAAPAPNAGRDA